jgi:hypothetical protein
MSLQLIVYPQSNDGTLNQMSSTTTEVLVYGNNFAYLPYFYTSTTSFPYTEALTNAPPSIPNVWYSFRSSVSGTPNYPSYSSGNLVLASVPTTSVCGVYQQLSNLAVGQQYTFTIDISNTGTGLIGIRTAQSNNITSVQTFSAGSSQITRTFTAFTQNDIVIVTYINNLTDTISISNMSIQPVIGAVPSGAVQLLGDGQVILDVYEDEDLPLTLSVDNFKNVAEKVQSYSKSFNLPGTKRNNKIFDQVFEVTRDLAIPSLLFNPYKKTRTVLKQDGFILFEGYLRLLDITDKNGEISYDVNLYSEVIAFADTLKDLTFQELDFKELEHLYNYTNIKLSRTNATSIVYTESNTSGLRNNTTLKYPFVDWTHQYTVDSSGNPILPNLESTFRPFINIKYLIDKIFAATDFNYESTFFNTDKFKSLYMDFNWGADENPNTNRTQGIAQYFFNASPDIYATDSYSNLTYLDVSMPVAAGFDASSNIFTCPSGQTNSSFRIPYKASVIAKRDGDIEFRWIKNRLTNPVIFDQSNAITLQGSAVAIFETGSLGDIDTVTIVDGGYYTSAPTLTIPNSSFGNGATFTTTIDGSGAVDSITIDTSGGSYSLSDTLVFNNVNPIYDYTGMITVPMEPGDTLEFQWKASISNYIRQNNSPFNNRTSFLTQQTAHLIAFVTVEGVTRDTLLQTLRGELGQWEFLKGLITMFNLVTMPDSDNPNNIKIEPYSDIFLNNTDVPLNWTDKVDVSEMKLKPLTNLNRNTIFKFLEDDDDYAFNQYKNSVSGHLYGSKKYDATDEFNILIGQDEIIAEPFAATVVKPLMSQYSDFIIPSLYSYNSESDTTEGFDNSPRIMFDNGLKILSGNTFSVPNQNDVTGNPTESEFLQFSHLSEIEANYLSEDFNFGECQLMPNVGSTLNNLFNTYWLPYYSELYNINTRIMTLKVNLSPADINSFLFSNTVLIKNRQYRVNKIDYKPNDLATVEFILIP